MGKSAAHDVGVAASYARRTTDSVVLTLHLPHATDADAGVLRLTRLGKRAKRRVNVPTQTAPAGTGVLVTASVPRAEVEPGRWQLRLRTADGSGYRRAKARLLVRPDQPVALMVGREPLTLMAPPKPRARPENRKDPAPPARTTRSRLRRVARRVRRLTPSR